MKLILHIGTVKTGTTSAQAWFSANREALARRGVWYPTALPATNMRPGGRSHPFAVDIVLSPEYFRQNALAAFRNEYDRMRGAGCRFCVISFEDLYFKLGSAQTVSSLAEFLRSYFESIEVVIYLRPQIDTAVSFASTASKLGVVVDKKWFLGQSFNRSIFDYDAAVRRWESAFGPNNVKCFSYKNARPFTDYVSEAAALNPRDFKSIENLNSSVGVNVVALSNVVQIPHLFSEALLQSLPRSAPLSVGSDLAQRFQAKFAESNADLVGRRSDIRPEDLEPDWTSYERPSNLDDLERECIFAEELKALMRVYLSQLSLERARNALMRAEIAKVQGRQRIMIAMANQAMKEVDGASRVEAFRGEAQKIHEVASGLILSRTGEVSLG